MLKLNPDLDVNSPDVVCWERGQHGGRTRPINREVLFKNLCEVREVFNKYGVGFWLSHGTALGVKRDGDFIEWDDDADIGIDFSDRDTAAYRKILKALEKRGFYIPPCDKSKPIDKDNAPYYDFVAIKDGEKIEGWFFEKKGDFYIYDEPRCGNILKHPAKFYDKMGSIFFKGIEFNTPAKLDEWLVLMYGEDWKTPNQDRKYNQQS